MDGRDADRRRVERTDCGETGLDRLEAGNAELCGGFGGDGRVAVDHCGELYLLACLLELAVDAKMIAPECSGSDNGNAEWMRGGHYFFSVRVSVWVSAGASTTWRQRA